MNYIETKIIVTGKNANEPNDMPEAVADVLAAMLGELGYDSFSTESDCLKAYCPVNLFDSEALNTLIAEFPLPDLTLQWVATEVETQNWNEQWEAENTLTPIEFGNETITIHPHMSFGSGHHETTSQLLEEIDALMSEDAHSYEHFTALDMGTGTGVLAIACAMRGAQVRAIEIDDWVAANAVDNVLLNEQAGRVHVECGDASLLGNGQRYDLVLANINRNVLVADMPAYVADMKAGATLLMSGFYEEDVPVIRERAESLGLTYVKHRNRNNWVVIKFSK